jgi:cell division protein FtsI (penicillin-binding protein 3)
VFAELAQEVLEYLGVPHDQPLKTKQQMQLAMNDVPQEEVSEQEGDNLTAMFDEVNSLPMDDPLRQPANSAAMAQNQSADQAFDTAAKQQPKDTGLRALPEKVLAAFHKNGNTTSVIADTGDTEGQRVEAPVIVPQVQARGNGAVVIDAGRRVAVPQFEGAALRSVVESAGHLGLRVQTLGSGLAKEQAPVAGTMVPVGTQVVVRFAR